MKFIRFVVMAAVFASLSLLPVVAEEAKCEKAPECAKVVCKACTDAKGVCAECAKKAAAAKEAAKTEEKK